MADLHTDAHYYQIRTEGTHIIEFDHGSSLTPLVSFGMRGDKKANQSRLGIEFTGSIDYSNPLGLTLYGTGSMLMVDKNTVQKVSATSTFKFDLGNDDLGTILEFSQSWGRSDADAQNSLGVVIYWMEITIQFNILMELKLIQKLDTDLG